MSEVALLRKSDPMESGEGSPTSAEVGRGSGSRSPPEGSEKSRSPPGESSRSRSPPAVCEKSRSPPGGSHKGPSPPGETNRDRSPAGETSRSRSPPGGTNKIRSPPGGTNKIRSPSGGTEKSSSTSGVSHQRPSPPEETSRIRSPPGETIGSPSPPAETNRSRSHLRGSERSHSTPGETNQSRSPRGVTERTRSPRGESSRSRSPTGETNQRCSPQGESSRNCSPQGETTRSRSPPVEPNRSRSPPGVSSRSRSSQVECNQSFSPQGVTERKLIIPGEAARSCAPQGKYSRSHSPQEESKRSHSPQEEPEGSWSPQVEAKRSRTYQEESKRGLSPEGASSDSISPQGASSGSLSPQGSSSGRHSRVAKHMNRHSPHSSLSINERESSGMQESSPNKDPADPATQTSNTFYGIQIRNFAPRLKNREIRKTIKTLFFCYGKVMGFSVHSILKDRYALLFYKHKFEWEKSLASKTKLEVTPWYGPAAVSKAAVLHSMTWVPLSFLSANESESSGNHLSTPNGDPDHPTTAPVPQTSNTVNGVKVTNMYFYLTDEEVQINLRWQFERFGSVSSITLHGARERRFAVVVYKHLHQLKKALSRTNRFSCTVGEIDVTATTTGIPVSTNQSVLRSNQRSPLHIREQAPLCDFKVSRRSHSENPALLLSMSVNNREDSRQRSSASTRDPSPSSDLPELRPCNTFGVRVTNLGSKCKRREIRSHLEREFDKFGRITFLEIYGLSEFKYALVCYDHQHEQEKALTLDGMFFFCFGSNVKVTAWAGSAGGHNRGRSPYSCLSTNQSSCIEAIHRSRSPYSSLGSDWSPRIRTRHSRSPSPYMALPHPRRCSRSQSPYSSFPTEWPPYSLARHSRSRSPYLGPSPPREWASYALTRHSRSRSPYTNLSKNGSPHTSARDSRSRSPYSTRVRNRSGRFEYSRSRSPHASLSRKNSPQSCTTYSESQYYNYSLSRNQSLNKRDKRTSVSPNSFLSIKRDTRRGDTRQQAYSPASGHSQFTHKKFGIKVTHFPDHVSDHDIERVTQREFRKYGNVNAEICGIAGEDRCALMYYEHQHEKEKALASAKSICLFGKEVVVTAYNRPEIIRGLQKYRWSEESVSRSRASMTLRITNLDATATSADLCAIFQVYGDILHIEVREEFAGKCVYLQFSDLPSACRAVKEVDTHLLGNRKLMVDFDHPQSATNCVWIYGLRYANIPDRHLTKVFTTFGHVVKLLYDRVKGTALVRYNDISPAINAVDQMSMEKIAGFRVRVGFANRRCQLDFCRSMESSGQDAADFYQMLTETNK